MQNIHADFVAKYIDSAARSSIRATEDLLRLFISDGVAFRAVDVDADPGDEDCGTYGSLLEAAAAVGTLSPMVEVIANGHVGNLFFVLTEGEDCLANYSSSLSAALGAASF